MRSPDLFELIAPPGTKLKKINHIPGIDLKMSALQSKKKDDDQLRRVLEEDDEYKEEAVYEEYSVELKW